MIKQFPSLTDASCFNPRITANDRNPVIDVDERKINDKFMDETFLISLFFFYFFDQKNLLFFDFLYLKTGF